MKIITDYINKPSISKPFLCVGGKLENISASTKKAVSDFFSSQPELLELLSHSGKIGIGAAVLVDWYTEKKFNTVITSFIFGISVCKIGYLAKEHLRSLEQKQVKKIS